MYNNFFGLKEKPFKLVPNPAYLYLSRTHEEALAHLRYAISQGDGFVLITGEVGTGKTTLCRAFLESLDENTEAAFIFNPKLDSIQLLKAINDEFEIPSDADNTKDLIDILNNFLMDKKKEGKNVILLIDEAQNLRESALEQLRLLSNLETSVSKLIQIILVGQPELGDMLDSYELRQLGQRITLSCHLVPLNRKETREYIQHRINIASQKTGIKYSRTAFRDIYAYSKGVPRLINIACDRSLLTAFGLNRQTISGDITRMAIRELTTRSEGRSYNIWRRKKELVLFSMLCLIFFSILLFHPVTVNNNTILEPEKKESLLIPQVAPVREEAEKIAVPEPTPVVAEKMDTAIPVSIIDLEHILAGMHPVSSRRVALTEALDLWAQDYEIKPYLDGINEHQHFFTIAASQNGFSIQRLTYNLSMLKKLNLPAIIELYPPGNQPVVYFTLSQIENERIRLKGSNLNHAIEVTPEILKRYSSGVSYIVWKNFSSYTGRIPIDAPPDSIIVLKMLLRDLGFDAVDTSAVYDEKTEQVIKAIQEKHGIKVDGIVGPLTRIVLYNEMQSLNIPHIIK